VNPRGLLLGCAIGAALIIPATASAATKPVSMGIPRIDAAKPFKNIVGDVNAFFPTGITIHRGDTVRFEPNGFHTLDFPPKGKTLLDLFVPTGDTIAGANDEAGSPFWFNGQPALGFNPGVGEPNWGKSFTLDRSKRIESGLPLGNDLDPIEVTFPKKGTFTYFCDVHPGMKGKVHVVAASSKAPSKRSDARRVVAQVKRALATIKKLEKTKTSAGTVQIGAAGPGGVESFLFFPSAPSVKVGTTLTFTMPVGSREVHTATTGPGNPLTDPDSYLGTLSGSFESPEPSMIGFYASDPPGGTPPTLTSALHGNGFWNSGLLDRFKATPSPTSNKVTFGQAGTFDFYCLIHPFMKATVTVAE
jgi:plastocyanin